MARQHSRVFRLTVAYIIAHLYKFLSTNNFILKTQLPNERFFGDSATLYAFSDKVKQTCVAITKFHII